MDMRLTEDELDRLVENAGRAGPPPACASGTVISRRSWCESADESRGVGQAVFRAISGRSSAAIGDRACRSSPLHDIAEEAQILLPEAAGRDRAARVSVAMSSGVPRAAQHQRCRVARHDAQQQEGHQRDADQHRHELDDPLQAVKDDLHDKQIRSPEVLAGRTAHVSRLLHYAHPSRNNSLSAALRSRSTLVRMRIGGFWRRTGR